MSSRSPHFRPHLRKDAELDKIIADHPPLAAALKRKPRVVETFDVPDTGGYDRRRDVDDVFIDRHLHEAAPTIEGKAYSVWREALVGHEWLEKLLIQILGYTYEGAHEFASMWENRILKRMGMRPHVYNTALKPFIKRARTETIVRPPPTIDCTPYRGERDPDDQRIMARFKQLGVQDAKPPNAKSKATRPIGPPLNHRLHAKWRGAA